MPSRQLAKFSVAVFAILASACGSSTVAPADEQELPAAFSQSLTLGPATFVLARAEQQVTDQIVTFDHMCPGGRITMALRDTLVLMAGGQMRRSYAIIRTMPGGSDTSTTSTTGTWRLTPLWRASRKPGLSLLIAQKMQDGRVLGEGEIRLLDANTVAFEGAMGGSCPGSPNDARNVDFFLTRR